MKRNIWIPISVGCILIALLPTMAFTDLFQPVIAFIHNRNITLLQAVGCIVGSALGFYIAYKVLVKLGEYFLPKD